MAIDPRIFLTSLVPQGPTPVQRGLGAFNEERDRQSKNKQAEAASEQNARRTKVLEDREAREAAEYQQKLEARNKTESMNDYAADMVALQSIVTADIDPGRKQEAARAFLQQRNAKLNNARERDPSIDTEDTNRLLSNLDNDPEMFAVELNSELAKLKQRGFIKTGKEGLYSAAIKIFKNGVTLQSEPDQGTTIVRNKSGQIVEGEERVKVLQEAYKAENEKLLSKEEVDQQFAIARYKQNLRETPAERALRVEQMENDIKAARLKIEETEETKRKGQGLKSESLRLVNKLLNNADGVRALVGPWDQTWISPTFLGDTLKAQTDINQLRSILTAENLGIMSGVLSETDVAIIAAIAGGGLDVNGEDEAFLEELGRMQVSLEAQTGGELTPEKRQRLEELRKQQGANQ